MVAVTNSSTYAGPVFYCNSFKGPNIAGIDPTTNKISVLFNPRTDSWTRHFVWNGAELIGKTPRGHTTIQVLAINNPQALALRTYLMHAGAFDPS
jgi:hypothetical protein